MTEEQQTQLLVLMSLIEAFDNVDAFISEIKDTDFENVTAETWKDIQEFVPGIAELIAYFRMSVTPAMKVIENAAAYSHVTTVMSSPDN